MDIKNTGNGVKIGQTERCLNFFNQLFRWIFLLMAERTDIRSIKIASSTLNNHSKHWNGR